jgi:hypothetical protein
MPLSLLAHQPQFRLILVNPHFFKFQALQVLLLLCKAVWTG